MNTAPWPDFAGNAIREGDTIRHQESGETGRVVFLPGEAEPDDCWRVDYGDGRLSRLGLQVGDKGRAVVVPGQVQWAEVKAALLAEIAHAGLNNMRLPPQFAQRTGPLAVPVSTIEAVIGRFDDMLAAVSGKRSANEKNPEPFGPGDQLGPGGAREEKG